MLMEKNCFQKSSKLTRPRYLRERNARRFEGGLGTLFTELSPKHSAWETILPIVLDWLMLSVSHVSKTINIRGLEKFLKPHLLCAIFPRSEVSIQDEKVVNNAFYLEWRPTSIDILRFLLFEGPAAEMVIIEILQVLLQSHLTGLVSHTIPNQLQDQFSYLTCLCEVKHRLARGNKIGGTELFDVTIGSTKTESNTAQQMLTNAKMASFYEPILPYQTRVLHLTHRPEATTTDPIECSLHVADILHPHFGGLGLRSADGKDDKLVKFCALSYAWGSQTRSKVLLCNGKQMKITENLHAALTAIRQRDYGTEYLWVDAMCINQDDEKEKAIQVSQMLQIFQQARQVIAWLGDPRSQLDDVTAATSLKLSKASFAAIDIEQVTRGARWLYEATWFERLWVQQELFASRSLRFLAGAHEFDQSPLLSAPRQFEKYLPQHQRLASSEYTTRDSWFKKKKKTTQVLTTSEGRKLLELLEYGASHLHCYQYFSQAKKVDLVEALLYTRSAKASNSLDYVYGVLGLSDFPGKAMSIQAWSIARNRESFVPIDYSTDLVSLYCVLSRILLSKLGLGLLAKFKVRQREEDTETEQDSLPSWAIDWRLTSLIVRPDPNQRFKDVRKLENAWDIHVTDCPDSQQLKNVAHVGRPKLYPWPRPPSHEQFCNMNKANGETNIGKLQLHGRVCTKAIINPKRRLVKGQFMRENRYQQIVWHPRVKLRWDDTVVSFAAFERVDYTSWMIVSQSTANGIVTREPFISTQPDLEVMPYTSGGLWILRPVRDGHFTLVACLSTIRKERVPPYETWRADETLAGDEEAAVPLVVGRTKNESIDTGPMKQEPSVAIEALLGEYRTFIIV